MVKPSIGERLVATGVLMVVMALTLAVVESVQGLGLGLRFSRGIGVAGVAVALLGLVLARRRD